MSETFLVGVVVFAVGLGGLLSRRVRGLLRPRRSVERQLSAETVRRMPRMIAKLLMAGGVFLMLDPLVGEPRDASDLALEAGTAATRRPLRPTPTPSAPLEATPSPQRLANEFDVDFFAAIRSGDLAVVEERIRRLADLDAPNEEGWPPLCWSIEWSQPAVAESLLEAGASPNSRLADGTPALFIAVSAGEDGIVDLLLAAGADPDVAEPGDGMSPLMLAVQEGKLEVIDRLLSAGADPALEDRFGRTAAAYAAGSETFLRRLEGAGSGR